jgi:hypothetical protein
MEYVLKGNGEERKRKRKKEKWEREELGKRGGKKEK